MTADELDALAESLLPRALDLVVQVHDQDEVAARGLLAELDWQQMAALCVVLASLVPDDERLDDLLGWTHPPAPPKDSPEVQACRRELLGAEVSMVWGRGLARGRRRDPSVR